MWGAGSYMSMEMLPDAVDYGDAPSFFACRPSRMFMISSHILRITFARKDVGPDGRERYLVSGHIDYDIEDLPLIRAEITRGLLGLDLDTALVALGFALAN